MSATVHRETGSGVREVAAQSDGGRRSATRTPARRRSLIRDLVIGHLVGVDHLGCEALVHSAQRCDAMIEGITDLVQAVDFVGELFGKTTPDLGGGNRSGRVLLTWSADTGTNSVEAQRSTAEHRDCRRAGVPADGLIQSQQRLDAGRPRVRAVANLRQRVAVRPATASHFLLGQVQLRDTCIDEMDKPLNAVGWNRHTPHPTARNTQYPRQIRCSGYVSSGREGYAA